MAETSAINDMGRKNISEQLLGYVWVLLIAIIVAGIFLFIQQSDHARENRDEARARTRYVKDSIASAREKRETERQEKIAKWEQQREDWDKKKAERKQRREAEADIEVILQPFDPNLADSSTLVHLGLRPWMAHNLLLYREKGGRYRKKEDLRRLYGMTDSLYLSLEPYIEIAEVEPDTTAYPRYVSIKRDTIIELNTADTTSLQFIRGIGSYTARQIIWRREALGGFYSNEQIREIERIHRVDSLLPHLIADPSLIHKLEINKTGVERLMKHPYISFEQAKAIREWRHRHGDIASIETLRTLEANGRKVFSEEELLRLTPYLSFEK